MEFKFETLRETEKAVFAKVPYYEATNERKKSHKQMFFECWIPKIVLEKGKAKEFVIRKREELRCSNAYQRNMSGMPPSYQTFGEYAPIKTPVKIEVLDGDRFDREREAMIQEILKRYGGESFRQLITDEVGTKGEVSDEDLKVMSDLWNFRLPKKHNKQVTIYK